MKTLEFNLMDGKDPRKPDWFAEAPLTTYARTASAPKIEVNTWKLLFTHDGGIYSVTKMTRICSQRVSERQNKENEEEDDQNNNLGFSCRCCLLLTVIYKFTIIWSTSQLR